MEVGHAELEVFVGHPGINTGWARDRAFKSREAHEGLQMDEVAQREMMESWGVPMFKRWLKGRRQPRPMISPDPRNPN